MKKTTFLCKLVFCMALCCGSACAQMPEDITECFKEGQKYYRNGNLSAAALEFENMLSIDKHNFEAKVWLAQVYIDMKAFSKAKILLFEAALQSPDHPRVVELQRLLGTVKAKPTEPEADSSANEMLSGLGKAFSARKYGIVIPENKVANKLTEEDLLLFNEQNEERQKDELPDYSSKDTGPFAKVFEIEKKEGIAKALNEYFKIIFKDPSLAGVSDKGLLERGRSLYFKRYSDDNKTAENRFYYGAITYMNGSIEEADSILNSLRNNQGAYKDLLKPIFDGIDKWKEQKAQEEERIKQAELARLAKEEEERLRKENEEKQRKILEEYGVPKKQPPDSEKIQNVSENVESSPVYKAGYDLYKRGKLDEAIEKFQQALKEYGDKPSVHYRLGLAYTDKAMGGDMALFEAAITSFQKVIAIEPNSKLADESRVMIKDIESVYKSTGQ